MTDFVKTALMMVLTIGSNTIAQLLLKQGAQVGNLLNPYFIGGVSFYGISTIFYMAVLKQVSLSIAYPTIIGITIVLTTLLNNIVFKEKLFAGQLIGIVLIISGISAITTVPKQI